MQYLLKVVHFKLRNLHSPQCNEAWEAFNHFANSAFWYPRFPRRFLDALASLKTMLDIKWLSQWLMFSRYCHLVSVMASDCLNSAIKQRQIRKRCLLRNLQSVQSWASLPPQSSPCRLCLEQTSPQCRPGHYKEIKQCVHIQHKQ